jgi:hypothetical protein
MNEYDRCIAACCDHGSMRPARRVAGLGVSCSISGTRRLTCTASELWSRVRWLVIVDVGIVAAGGCMLQTIAAVTAVTSKYK